MNEQREITRPMATYFNPSSDVVVVKIHQLPGHGPDEWECQPGGTVKGPANYVEAFKRQGLVLHERQKLAPPAARAVAPAAGAADDEEGAAPAAGPTITPAKGKGKGGKGKAPAAGAADDEA